MKKELKINADKYMRGILQVKEIVEEYGAQYGKKQVIDFRIKSTESIACKLKKKGHAATVENAERYLNDLAGIRVVCSCEEEVYKLGEYLCAREDLVVLRRKDYIKNPKENGYQSLHLILEVQGICVEIQIRTKAMHSWAQIDHKRFYKKLTN